VKIIVDTNILIDFSRKKRIKKEEILWPKLVSFAKREGHQLVLPTIALFELFSGNEMKVVSNREKTENILKDVVVLDLNEEIAKKGASLFRQYQANVGPIDYILAATTFILKGELATLNPKHFSIFKELSLFNLSKL